MLKLVDLRTLKVFNTFATPKQAISTLNVKNDVTPQGVAKRDFILKNIKKIKTNCNAVDFVAKSEPNIE